MAYVKIQRGKGKYQKQFRFTPFGDNGKPLDPRDYYHNHDDLVDMLIKYYPNFQIIDETGVKNESN